MGKLRQLFLLMQIQLFLDLGNNFTNSKNVNNLQLHNTFRKFFEKGILTTKTVKKLF